MPAGLAFARSIAKKPTLGLYVAYKRHPSLAGTYLAACTVYASLFKKSRVGLEYVAGLGEATALHVQTTAWETVAEHFEVWGRREAYFGARRIFWRTILVLSPQPAQQGRAKSC